MDGYTLVKTLRERGDQIPVLLLTAKQSFEDKREGFSSGVDDYMTKPVNYEELIWRLDALRRRAHIASEHRIVVGRTVLDSGTYTVTREMCIRDRCNIPAVDQKLPPPGAKKVTPPKYDSPVLWASPVSYTHLADEVRNLAFKSDQAAKATKELIESSVESVQNGNAIVTNVTDSLQKTTDLAGLAVDDMVRVAEMVDTISAAIAQVTVGLDQISAVVQTLSLIHISLQALA